MFTAILNVSGKGLVNTFCFDTDRCSSYLIGSSTVKSANLDSETVEGRGCIHGEEDFDMEGAKVRPDTTITTASLMEKVNALETDLIKMQAMILLHDGQLRDLPGYPAAARDGEGEGL